MVYTIVDGGFYPHSAVVLIFRGRARATVVRQLKVPIGFAAVLRIDLTTKQVVDEEEQGDMMGSDYAGLISRIEKELCTIEDRDGKEPKNGSGRRDAVAYCWKNAIGGGDS